MSDQETQAAPPAVNFDDLFARYIALRDLKDKYKKEYQKKVEDIDAGLERCEAFILTHLTNMGVKSISTPAGTAYQSTRTTASVADWPMVLDWIKQKGEWDMLERRVNKSFVEAFRNEYDDLPPGVNWREEKVVNVRRS